MFSAVRYVYNCNWSNEELADEDGIDGLEAETLDTRAERS